MKSVSMQFNHDEKYDMNTDKKQYDYNKIVCHLILPYCVYVPEEEFIFPNKDVVVSLTFRRYIRNNESDHFNFNQKHMIVEKDRFGRYDYSGVDIILRKNDFHYDPTFETNKIKHLALNSVRKFIQFYKLAYDTYWIIEPSISDILSFQVKCYKNEVNIPGAVMTLLDTANANSITSLQDYLDKKKYSREEMLNRLNANYELPLYIQLMVEGTRLCSVGSFDVAVILIDRSFENFFDTIVKVYLHHNHLFEKEWAKYLEMDLIGRKANNSKLKSYSSKVSKSGEEFNGEINLYKEWYSKCRSLRNDVIHGKKSNIEEEEAYEAWQSARNAFTFFGFSWFDAILISDKYFDKSKNVYGVPIPAWFNRK